MPIFKHHSYFSVTSHVLNDVNVREGSVKNRHTSNQYWSEVNSVLSHDVASESDITPCNKIDKPLVVYRFTGNVMMSIKTLRKIREILDVFTPKMHFLSILMSCDK